MLAELRVTPFGSRAPFAHLIAGLVPILSESSLCDQVHAMGTTLEGELDDILAVVRRCHLQLRRQAERVMIDLVLYDRAQPDGAIARASQRVGELCPSSPLEWLAHDGPVGVT
jgi:uncharacterized protein YqgV (UPF0045/DUF77 family)